jgi:CHAD domain-containing protein
MGKSRKAKATGKAAAAAAAAAVAGAAAAGGKLVHARRAHANAEEERDRRYRLRTDEQIPDGVRRIARGRLDDACDRLDAAGERELDAAVHDTRKDLKRLRACLRLARDAVGEQTYERENATFRMAGRRLSGARDAQVLVEALDALQERFADELAPESTSALRALLSEQHATAVAQLRADGTTIAATRADLEAARTRVAAWTLSDDGFDALRPGLRRIYARGRKRIRAAAEEPTDERLHEARKRVKDLWYATQIVRPAAPKELKRMSGRAHDVAGLLGDDHDLAVLRERILAHPQCFADDAAMRALLAVIDRRRAALQRRALKRGARLYERSPKRFAADVDRRWRKRAGGRPGAVAG